MHFEPHETIAELQHAYALDCVDMAAANFDVTLDFSEASVDQVEAICALLHSSPAPPPDVFEQFCKMLGFYVSEVICRHLGATPGIVRDSSGASMFGLSLPDSRLCWPVGRLQNRLVNGSEDDVTHYYRHIKSTLAA